MFHTAFLLFFFFFFSVRVIPEIQERNQKCIEDKLAHSVQILCCIFKWVPVNGKINNKLNCFTPFSCQHWLSVFSVWMLNNGLRMMDHTLNKSYSLKLNETGSSLQKLQHKFSLSSATLCNFKQHIFYWTIRWRNKCLQVYFKHNETVL